MATIRTPEEFDTQPYGRLLVREADGGYSGEILEFPGCISEGETANEVVARLEENAKDWIESELEAGRTIPGPVSGDEHSGRIALRLPRSLHRAIALKAARDRTSTNQQIVSAIAAWVGADGARQEMMNYLAHQIPYTVMGTRLPSVSGAVVVALLGFDKSSATNAGAPLLSTSG